MIVKILRQCVTLVEPIGLIWLCLFILAVLLWKRQRRLALAAFGLWVFITVIGGSCVPGMILGSLERPYAGVKFEELPPADAIVVLGGGAEPSRFETGRFHLTMAGDRLTMALDMARLRKSRALVIGGAGAEFDDGFISESTVVSKWFEQWKQAGALDPALEILPLNPCSDTHDEALGVRALADKRGWRRVLLVTSANHMRRAVALFQSQGLEVTPVPCNFLTNVSTAPGPQVIGLPSWEGFVKIATWLHEEIGWYEYRRRGWIK